MSTDEWLDAAHRHDEPYREKARRQAEAIVRRMKDPKARFMALMQESVRAEELAAEHHAAFEVFREHARAAAEAMAYDQPDHDQITIAAGPERHQTPDETAPSHP